MSFVGIKFNKKHVRKVVGVRVHKIGEIEREELPKKISAIRKFEDFREIGLRRKNGVRIKNFKNVDKF